MAEDGMRYNDFIEQLKTSQDISGDDNPEIVVELPDGSCLEISQVQFDRGEKILLIQTEE